MTRGWLSAAVIVTCLTLTPTFAHADPVKCGRAIAKASSLLAQSEMAAATKCEQAKLHGSLPSDTECRTEPKTAAAIDKARGKLQSTIARACGGANKTCAADDAGADADDPLAAIGWDLDVCPGFEGLPCSNPIADCDDIATCVQCVTEGAVDQARALYFDAFTAASPSDALGKCQVAIGKEAAKFFGVQSKVLQKCEDQVLDGKLAGPCPTGESQLAIDKAEMQKADRICGACGGTDRACGGADDLSPASIGFAANCPAVTAPGNTSCAGPITSLQDLVDCVDCVTAYKGACLDALSVPGVKPYPDGCRFVATPTPTATPTTTQTPSPTPTAAAGQGAVGCERVITKEAARFVQTKIKNLGRCESAKLTGKLPSATDCPNDGKVLAAVGKASTRFTGQVAKACGGGNRACDASDTGPDADESLAEIGWAVPACPNFENGACSGMVADCGDVGTCIACVAEAAVEQASGFYFGVTPADPATAEGKCELAIGKAATSLYTTRALALAKCAGSALAKGEPIACPDTKAASTIAKAEDKLIKTMCKACGGGDGLCGGGDDIGPAQLGFPATCPAVTVPGGNACGGTLGSLDDLVACVACLTSFTSECTDRIAIPNRGYPPECNPMAGPTPTPMGTPGPTPTVLCGDGIKQTGEDCDDGNTANCDACPRDCKTSHAPVQCTATTVRHTQSIHLVPPPGAVLSAGVFCIDYPAGVVALPGTGNVPVGGRVSGVNAITSLNDFNNAVQFGFVANPGFTEVTPVLSFDLCTGAAAPPPTDFSCVVKNASNQGDSIEPPSLVECTPVMP